jgi:hypothetical protein
MPEFNYDAGTNPYAQADAVAAAEAAMPEFNYDEGINPYSQTDAVENANEDVSPKVPSKVTIPQKQRIRIKSRPH